VTRFANSHLFVDTRLARDHDARDRMEMEGYITTLRGFIDILNDRIPATQLAKVESTEAMQPMRTGSAVFLVHGHDEAAKEKVALFLTRLPTELIALRGARF
jgi:hypothetical protein